MKYIAYCTKGLEKIVHREISSIFPDLKIDEIGDKRIIFETQSDYNKLIKLRTVDDIGLFVTKIENTSSLEHLLTALEQIDLAYYKELLGKNRTIDKTFSITASTVGNRTRPNELINIFAKHVKQKYNWQFTERDHTNFDIRIFVDHKTCYISIRLTKESLHHRAYKTISRIGSLKPTVAAAMVFLTIDTKQNLKIVDNFCGSGTILCEALEMKNEVFGGDIERDSINITKTNLDNLNYNSENKIKLLDATQTSWPSNFFDCAISNLPWDKQIEVLSITDLYIGTLREYKRILRQNGIACLLISKPELLIKHAKKIFINSTIECYKLGLLGQNPTIVVIHQ